MLLKRRIIVRTTKLVGNVECQMYLVLEKVRRKKLFRWKILGEVSKCMLIIVF